MYLVPPFIFVVCDHLDYYIITEFIICRKSPPAGLTTHARTTIDYAGCGIGVRYCCY